MKISPSRGHFRLELTGRRRCRFVLLYHLLLQFPFQKKTPVKISLMADPIQSARPASGHAKNPSTPAKF